MEEEGEREEVESGEDWKENEEQEENEKRTWEAKKEIVKEISDIHSEQSPKRKLCYNHFCLNTHRHTHKPHSHSQ